MQLEEIYGGAFVGKIRGCYNFTSNKNKALQSLRQIMHLEGAFPGIF